VYGIDNYLIATKSELDDEFYTYYENKEEIDALYAQEGESAV